jgi:hypothetical protein
VGGWVGSNGGVGWGFDWGGYGDEGKVNNMLRFCTQTVAKTQ